MTKLQTLKICLGIAVIIFFMSVLSDFSVRMFYSSTDATVQILAGLIAIVLIAFAIAVLLWAVPDLRKALMRIFGMEEESTTE